MSSRLLSLAIILIDGVLVWVLLRAMGLPTWLTAVLTVPVVAALAWRRP